MLSQFSSSSRNFFAEEVRGRFANLAPESVGLASVRECNYLSLLGGRSFFFKRKLRLSSVLFVCVVCYDLLDLLVVQTFG